MIRRSTRHWVSLTLLGTLLFAQAALAIAACDWLRVAPAMALMANADEPTCHEQPAHNPNLCLAHCLSFDQSKDKPQPQFQVLALPAAPMVVLATPFPRSRSVIESRFWMPRAAVPPPRILFQSFLI